MIEQYSEGKLTWIDLTEPTPEEIRQVIEEYDVPPELAGDWGGVVTRSGAIFSDDVMKVTMDFPIVKRTDITHPHEMKFIVMKDTLITVRYEDIEAVHRFKKEFEVITSLNKAKKTLSGTHLFIALLHSLYDALESKLDYIETKLSDIEVEIFNHREKEMVVEISSISRRLIVFRQTLKAHDDVFRDAKPIFDENYTKASIYELNELHNEYFHIARRTLALFETLDELRDTNMALLTTKQNEIMKTLTIMAFITFPLTLLTSMFGMNTLTTPIVGNPGDFWMILGIMTIATIGFFVFFKSRRWI